MEPRAFLDLSELLSDENPRDPQYIQRSKEFVPPHPRGVVDPHERKAGILVDQNDVDEAFNKADDA